MTQGSRAQRSRTSARKHWLSRPHTHPTHAPHTRTPHTHRRILLIVAHGDVGRLDVVREGGGNVGLVALRLRDVCPQELIAAVTKVRGRSLGRGSSVRIPGCLGSGCSDPC